MDGDGVAGVLPDLGAYLGGTASLWLPSPRAINEPRSGWPSMLPRMRTRPRVPKYSAEPGVTT